MNESQIERIRIYLIKGLDSVELLKATSQLSEKK